MKISFESHCAASGESPLCILSTRPSVLMHSGGCGAPALIGVDDLAAERVLPDLTMDEDLCGVPLGPRLCIELQPHGVGIGGIKRLAELAAIRRRHRPRMDTQVRST
jgi:hypothetical protein